MTDAIYEEARIYPTDKRGQRELAALLEKEGIRRWILPTRGRDF